MSGRRKFSDGSRLNTGGWEVVYAGFVLILLCFFIMLCSFASTEQAKVMRFVRSFVVSLSVLPGGSKLEEGKSILHASPDIVDRENELGRIFLEMKRLVKEHRMDSWVSLVRNEEGIAMRLANRMLYGLGSAEIVSDAHPILEDIARLLSRITYHVRVEGHTDDLPIRSERFPSNWELSTSRAVNVLRYIIGRSGIEPARISAVGFGEFQPIAPNDTESNRSKNRRVEIVIIDERSRVKRAE
jgi:chemotaxis protein MotB